MERVLPSQFLSVVLEESNRKKCPTSATIYKNKNSSSTLSESVTITPITPSSNGQIKVNGKYPSLSKARKEYNVLRREVKWDITKHLPPTLLEECTVEIANSSSQKQKENAAELQNGSPIIITPIKKAKLEKRKPLKGKGNLDVRDIINQVEVVYSDDEEPGNGRHLSSKIKSKDCNGHSAVNGSSSNGLSSLGHSSSIYLPYACDHCPNKYNNRGALWQHSVASHSIEKTCECQLCGRKFYRNCSLALHMKCHSDEQSCSCKICGKEFSRLSLLEKHSRSHIDTTRICKICGKKLNDQIGLQKHLLIHHNEKYSCELCNVTFNTKQLVELHFDMTHNRNETPFICKLCKARFGNLRELSEHSLLHTSEKLHITCQYCGDTFPQRSAYKKHLQMHMGDRLRCDICKIDFTQRSSLLRHLKRLHAINGTKSCISNMNGNTSKDNIDEFIIDNTSDIKNVNSLSEITITVNPPSLI